MPKFREFSFWSILGAHGARRRPILKIIGIGSCRISNQSLSPLDFQFSNGNRVEMIVFKNLKKLIEKKNFFSAKKNFQL